MGAKRNNNEKVNHSNYTKRTEGASGPTPQKVGKEAAAESHRNTSDQRRIS